MNLIRQIQQSDEREKSEKVILGQVVGEGLSEEVTFELG